MSEKFEKVKYYYDNKYWDKNRVRRAVGTWITAEEYKQITGENYS